MRILVNLLKRIILAVNRLLSNTKAGCYANEIIINDVMRRGKSVTHNNVKMQFVVPNQLNHFRLDTFSIKEPETLDWINSMPLGCVLWDIGANVGLYSVYAAKKKHCRVVAFEPSVFNLELLARNIFLNDLQEWITIVPVALSDEIGPNQMCLTTTEWGGALSSFGKNIGWDGQPINDIFSFQTLGFNMDQAVKLFKLPQPDFIKMDVDGVEHIILQGGKHVLDKVKGVLVEINDDFKEQSEKSKHYLENAGLVFKKKLHSEIIEKSTAGFANSFNQIWIRKPNVQ